MNQERSNTPGSTAATRLQLLLRLGLAGVVGIAASAAPLATAESQAALGRALFFDPGLSASGRLACASCHSPARAYGPPNDLAIQLGGPDLKSPGIRAVPSLAYTLNRTPIWSIEQPADPNESIGDPDIAPKGGFGWDGRYDRLRDQAAFPLYAPNEMANAGAAAVAARLARAPYAGRFRALFGAHVFDDPTAAVRLALTAIETFELSDRSFHRFSSRFGAWLDGKAALSEQELRGKALFEAPDGGNCASCHPDTRGADGSHPLFTDFHFEAVGVPRNGGIPANANPAWFDLGLCGPLRTDQAAQQTWCGMFKTPTLRNVATRGAFFHNGRFRTLRETLEFYVQRDTDPGRWYPCRADGSINRFDDLPAALRPNVDTLDAPLNRQAGEAPVWNAADIDAVIAFLTTLNDR
jgi:cytochrome c peroxidase